MRIKIKMSTIVLILSWISIFAMSWLMVLKVIERDIFSWGFFIWFSLVAFLSGLYHSSKP